MAATFVGQLRYWHALNDGAFEVNRSSWFIPLDYGTKKLGRWNSLSGMFSEYLFKEVVHLYLFSTDKKYVIWQKKT